MTPEQLDKAKWDEAYDRAMKADREGDPHQWEQAAVPIYRQLTIDNWTPPDPISPRVMAAREYAKGACNGRMARENAEADFLAGFAAAVKLAEPLVRYLEGAGRAKETLTTYRQSIGDE